MGCSYEEVKSFPRGHIRVNYPLLVQHLCFEMSRSGGRKGGSMMPLNRKAGLARSRRQPRLHTVAEDKLSCGFLFIIIK